MCGSVLAVNCPTVPNSTRRTDVRSLYIFAVWSFLALGALALIRLRAMEPDLPRPYRVWAYPWTPLLFLIVALALTVNLWLDQPIRSSVGLIVILMGLPCYHAWLGRTRRLESAQTPSA